jgi:hypothetical protein
LAGEDSNAARARRRPLDWLLVLVATVVFIWFGSLARVPALQVAWGWAAALTHVHVGVLVVSGVSLWRATRLG